MIQVKTVILAEGANGNGIYVTEEACKSFVEKFKPEEPIVVTFANSPIPAGVVKTVGYDAEKKVVWATVELNFVFGSSVNILHALDTPNEKRILDCRIQRIVLNMGRVGNGKQETGDEGNKS